MANHIKVWDEGNTNVETTENFESDASQRGTGFVAGTPASSKWMNSALREATLFPAAFMEFMNEMGRSETYYDNIKFDSSISIVKNIFKEFLHGTVYRVRFTTGLFQGDPLGLNTDNIEVYVKTKNPVPSAIPSNERLFNIFNNAEYIGLSPIVGSLAKADYASSEAITLGALSACKFLPINIRSYITQEDDTLLGNNYKTIKIVYDLGYTPSDNASRIKECVMCVNTNYSSTQLGTDHTNCTLNDITRIY